MVEYTKIKKVHIETAGTLSELLCPREAEQLEVLILSGFINQKDFDDVLDDLCSFWASDIDDDDVHHFDWSEAPALRVLDMGECELVGTTSLPYFGYHMQLDKIVLPKNTQSTGIGYDFALEDSFLREIVLPPSLKEIEGIRNCERLEHINIPDSVETLGYCFLSGCPCLKELHIPANVSTIVGGLASDNNNIQAFTIAKDNAHFTSVDGVVFTKDLKKLVAYPCGKAISIYEVPYGTEIIGKFAFSGCMLNQVILPDSLKTIEDQAFYACDNLQNIDLPDSVTELGFRNFAYCYKLNHIRLSHSLTEIKEQMFNGCCSLKVLDVPESVKKMYISAFAWNESGFEEIILHEGFEEISTGDGPGGGFLLTKNAILKKMDFPSTVKSIHPGILTNCTEMKSFNVAEDNPFYKTIDGAIYTKNGKTLVAVPDRTRSGFTVAEGTETISGACFWCFCEMTHIGLPNTLRKIGSRAFDSCESLVSISLPASIEKVDYRAFDNCPCLEHIYIYATQPPQLDFSFHPERALVEHSEKVVIHVQASAIENYLSAPQWKGFKIISI